MKKQHIIIAIIAIILMIVLDQVSKVLTIQHIALGEEIKIINNFFSFGHAKNTGISYGGFSDASPLFFIGVYVLAIGVFAYLAREVDFVKKKLYSISIIMMIAGGIGNLIDRVLFGEVTDMLILIIFNRELFGIFNIADVFLVVGMIIFSIDLVYEDVIKKWKQKPSSS
jgi:signal peptidase II